MDDLMTAGEAARRLNLDKRSVLAAVRRGELPALRDGRGWHWFRRADLKRFAEQRQPRALKQAKP